MKKLKIVLLVIVAATLLSFLINLLIGRGVGQVSVSSKPKIGLIKVKGVIRSSDKYLKLLDRAQKDKSVKAVVLRVDSPGGVVGACQEIHDKVKELKEKKPVVVSMGSIAASGGLYISVPATKIVANPGTITGSIGVIIQTYNLKKLAEKVGVEVITVKSGRFKDLLNPFKEPDPEALKIVQQLIDDSYSQFVEAVSKGRKIPIEKVKEFADGRIFTGRRAKELGLVDELGSLEKAVKVAREIAKCPECEVKEIKEKRSLLEVLAGEGVPNSLKNLLKAVRGEVEEVNLMYLFR